MDAMDSTAQLISLIIGTGIVGVMAEGFRRLFARMRQLEAKEKVADTALIAERDTLKKRVDELEPLANRVPGLEKQVATLIEQLSAVQQRLDNYESENHQLRADKDRLEKALTAALAHATELEIENRTFRQALVLLGFERADVAKKTEPEAAPEPSDSALPPSSEEAVPTASPPNAGEGK